MHKLQFCTLITLKYPTVNNGFLTGLITTFKWTNRAEYSTPILSVIACVARIDKQNQKRVNRGKTMRGLSAACSVCETECGQVKANWRWPWFITARASLLSTTIMSVPTDYSTTRSDQVYRLRSYGDPETTSTTTLLRATLYVLHCNSLWRVTLHLGYKRSITCRTVRQCSASPLIYYNYFTVSWRKIEARTVR